MHFASRLQAGRTLAARLVDTYRYENCAVLALNDGGVMVGAQIAIQLHCVLTFLLASELTAGITLPGETEPIAGISLGGTIAYNGHYGQSEMAELRDEYRVYIEEQKLAKIHDMNVLLGSGGTIKKELLRGHNIIVVSDGIKQAADIDLAYEFLKPITIEKLIVATPLASLEAVDRMHVIADELYCLDVVENYGRTKGYYDTQDVPDHQAVVKTIEQIVLNWK